MADDNLEPWDEDNPVPPSSHDREEPTTPILTMAEPGFCNRIDGRSMLGFSLTSPDLVICAGSPDIPANRYGSSPEFVEKNNCSIEVSLENGINGSDTKYTQKTPSVKFSTVCQTFEKELSPDSSFELLPLPAIEENSQQEDDNPVISINAGSTEGAVALGGVEFSEDDCFIGGEVMKTEAIIGEGDSTDLYKTARFGNFSYRFPSLKPGSYIVDLHFAEIVFTRGPPGIRVFDVLIQEQKVVPSLDIYGQVGANHPLIISDIKTVVNDDEGLFVRFQGVVGIPIVCGISVRKATPTNFLEAESFDVPSISKVTESESSRVMQLSKDSSDCMVDGQYQELQREYESQKKELMEMRKAMEELKKENTLKNKEKQEAWRSLKELQNELVRKSMHVGSLAFAIEGQVKEKSRWFSSLRDMTRKLKIIKMQHVELSEEASTFKNSLADVNKISDSIQSIIKQQVQLHEDLTIKFTKGAKERKELYNKVLELKGNIRVFCRCRPLKTEEITAGASMAIDFESTKDGELTILTAGAPKKTFKFDAVFGPEADQADIFEDTSPFATSVLDGYNVCIFAYGQTGTGKTFTMEGTEEARGVNFRTLEELFRIIEERERQYRYDISVSVLEVYNEQIRDLLVSSSQPGVAAKRLEIRQVSEGEHHVPGLAEAHVNNMSEVWEVLQTGSNARAIGSTNANEHSSRSHCIHCVMVKGENLLTGERTKSKLWLVDLAGSERVAKTEVQGERLKETQNINRSLSALGDVISALATKSPHIPFRNSKLTHLLQDSLGGDSKTVMFVQISPKENDLGETLCSLNFASRVRGIELGPAKKHVDNPEVVRCKQMVEKSKQDLKIKDLQIKKMEETVHGLDMKIKERDLKNKNLQDKVKELESQLLVERKLARQHVDTKIAEQQQQQIKQLQEEQNNAPFRPTLASRPLSGKNSTEVLNGSLPVKEQVNLTQPLVENNFKPYAPLPSTDDIVKHIDPAEKENNNPEMAEHLRLQPRTGRASICPTARRMPLTSAPRRISLIPLPSAPNATQLPRPLSTLLPCQASAKEEADELFPEQTLTITPKGIKSGGTKLSSILRRSIHKRAQLKSPMHQQLRRGLNVGTERVRVSIGSRGRMAHKVAAAASSVRRGGGGGGGGSGTRDIQQKNSQKEKERGWNMGTVCRPTI